MSTMYEAVRILILLHIRSKYSTEEIVLKHQPAFYQYKTDKIILLYISVFTSLHRTREDKIFWTDGNNHSLNQISS